MDIDESLHTVEALMQAILEGGARCTVTAMDAGRFLALVYDSERVVSKEAEDPVWALREAYEAFFDLPPEDAPEPDVGDEDDEDDENEDETEAPSE